MPANTNFSNSPGASFKLIVIIHLALLAGQVLFAAVCILITPKIIINVRDTQSPFVYLAPTLAVIGVLMGNFLYTSMLKNISDKKGLAPKLTIYQSAHIVRCALLEGPSLFAIVVFFLTGELYYLIISVFIMGYFIYLRPTKEKVAEAACLTYEEKAEFNQP
jgi:hypothetical protein